MEAAPTARRRWSAAWRRPRRWIPAVAVVVAALVFVGVGVFQRPDPVALNPGDATNFTQCVNPGSTMYVGTWLIHPSKAVTINQVRLVPERVAPGTKVLRYVAETRNDGGTLGIPAGQLQAGVPKGHTFASWEGFRSPYGLQVPAHQYTNFAVYIRVGPGRSKWRGMLVSYEHTSTVLAPSLWYRGVKLHHGSCNF